MADVIKLLPDFVANQIAAGEVIQRPASVVKELVENSLDAGATEITIIIKDAGRTLIQIIDNGKGMSPTDARMSFERHSTSKISSANDLFALTTRGFRGEALASIAAVAEVELKTKQQSDNVGTFICISGSKILSQDICSCPNGTNFSVKNLFFNIPVRRKFLKADNTELKLIKTEIYRIVLTNPKIKFTFVCDNKTEFVLNPENIKIRIVNVFGKRFETDLIPIKTETSLANISGFVSVPEKAKRTNNEQFFFVNNRYMNHPYFRKAVYLAYDKLLKEGDNPSFFIYFDVLPDKIDVNIHPTKTEIKFEDENYIFQILQATVKQAFGKLNISSNMHFEEDIVKDAHLLPNTKIKSPILTFDPTYNPFDLGKNDYADKNSVPKNWQKMFEDSVENSDGENIPVDRSIYENLEQTDFDINENNPKIKTIFYQFKHKYIITSSLSGMVIVDQRRAHLRILNDKYFNNIKNGKFTAQKLLFPIIYEPPIGFVSLLKDLLKELEFIGFELHPKGENEYEIFTVPSNISNEDPIDILENMFFYYTEYQQDAKKVLLEKIALSLAKATIMKKDTVLSEEAMETLYADLLLSSNANYTPDGKRIIYTFSLTDIQKFFNQ